jgi:hypothetical protein
MDRVIRASTAVAVLALAGLAAYISYWHAYAVVRAHGESGITARLEPATIDGLVYASSMVVLYAARHQLPVPPLARWLLGLGIAATLATNMAQGWSQGPIGVAVAAWPAVSLVGSYELLVWLIHTARTPGRAPAGQAASLGSERRALVPPLPASPADGGQYSRDAREEQHQPQRPARLLGGRTGATVSEDDDQAITETQAVNSRAVAAYRLSVQAGNPLSERKLAQMFGRTSRRWARARIIESRGIPRPEAHRKLPDAFPSGIPTAAYRRACRPAAAPVCEGDADVLALTAGHVEAGPLGSHRAGHRPAGPGCGRGNRIQQRPVIIGQVARKPEHACCGCSPRWPAA